MNISQDAVEPASHLDIQNLSITGTRSIRVPEQGLITIRVGTETSWMPLTKSSSYHAENFKPYAN